MLRPATPLTVLLFCAFVLLLLSTISTPIIKSIPLARYQDASFGVFGYCSDSKGCSGFEVGFNTEGLFTGQSADRDFNLPSSSRHSLSSLLIVHPIAALFCLVMLALAAAAHFHAPSHSPRYLLALLILTLPTLLITLLAFLVDVLLFIPHLAWGGWIVLVAVVLIVTSGIMLCAMRRTLVSRKARKKRIAENAEMSGEAFYARQREEEAKMAVMPPPMSSESKTPLVNGPPSSNGYATHAAFSTTTPGQQTRQADMSGTPISPVSGENRYYSNRSRSTSRHRSSGDGRPVEEYDLAMMPGQTAGGISGPQRLSQEMRNGNPPPVAYSRTRGYGPPRGRGGPPRGTYGPGPRGGYRGPPPPGPPGFGRRGSHGADSRGGMPLRGRGGGPIGPVMAGAVGGAAMGAAMNRRPPPSYPLPQPPPPGPTQYGQGELAYGPVSPSEYGPTSPTLGYTAYSNGPAQPMHHHLPKDDGLARADSPPPDNMGIGHAVAMDATTGRASTISSPSPPEGNMPNQQEYISPRPGWSNNSQPAPNRPRGTSVVSDHSQYYEDVDPKFAEPAPPMPGTVQHEQQLSAPSQFRHGEQENDDISPLPHSNSSESIPNGARSPAMSEQSAFTSISQRPINPNWRPGNGGEFNQFGPPPRRGPNQAQARQDAILSNNPDFELPGMGPPRGVRAVRGGGMRGAPLMGGVPMPRQQISPTAVGLGSDGRYPEPVVPSGAATMREI